MKDLSEVKEEEWKLGELRASVIRPLAKQGRCSMASVLKAAKTLKLSVWQIYRLVKKCRNSEGLLTELVPKKSSGGAGKSRILKSQEFLINEIIEEMYLTPQRYSPARIIEEIRKRCFELKVKAPSNMTIRRRLHAISRLQLKKRGEKEAPVEPVVGCFPEVKYPLSVVQIDHTPVDIILVAPIDRGPIGRPYVTVAIDVYSRCIAGFVLALEPPSAVSVGLCLTHMAMKKSPLLERQKIDAVWPISGKPEKIHVDNGSDFHSAALTRGCLQHGIQIEYRPLGQPQYGGMIERVIGTFMELVHTIPGTTFSNVTERGEYDSDKHACLTLAELEHWFIIAITKYYHLKLHEGIKTTPLQRYKEGEALMKRDGIMFASIQNAKAFLIDFLPREYRILRREGFVLDHITYYSDGLRSLISESNKHGKFLIHRDPRDLSRIYVCLPNEEGYLDVPYRMLSRPSISLFEHRMALKRLKDRGKKAVDEPALFRAIEEIHNVVNSAVSTTRSMRRNRTRMFENKKVQPQDPVMPEESKKKVKIEDIKPFKDLESWR